MNYTKHWRETTAYRIMVMQKWLDGSTIGARPQSQSAIRSYGPNVFRAETPTWRWDDFFYFTLEKDDGKN